MEIQTRNEANTTVITITGRFDAVTAPDYEKKVQELIVGGDIRIVVDFAGLDYISSAALRRLLLLAKKATDAQGKVVLTSLRSQIRDIFDMAGFTPIFPIYATQEEAVRSF